MEIFNQVEIDQSIEKRKKIIDYCRYLISENIGNKVEIITPVDPAQSGSQLSISLKVGGKSVHEKLLSSGVYCDWREPNVIRVAPVPLYNTFHDIYQFVNLLSEKVR